MHTESLMLIFLTIRASAISLDFPDQVGEGEKYYVELERKSRSYGGCWDAAMSNLHTSCKQLTEEVQSRLALSFANCFLKHVKVDPCLCAVDMSVADCLHNCSERVFNTYREFFTHTQSVCHYLQHKEWQMEAARTAMLLAENSRKISHKLDESARSQSQILDLQRTSLSEQKRSIANNRILNFELQRSRENAKVLYDEFKSTTYEQKLLLFEVFDRMKNLQNFVLGEFTGVYTAAYYIIVATLVYILTSVPRTAEARIWLILVISLNAVSEKFLTSYTLKENGVDVNPNITAELLYERIWLCRKTACFLCAIVLVVFYYRYKDYNVINNELLREIQRQNAELQHFIKGLTLHGNMQHSLLTSARFEKIEDTVKNHNSSTMKHKDVNTSVAVHAKMSNEVAASPLRVTPKRRGKKNKENDMALAEHRDLSNLASPSPGRYNLRSSSSSRMNSP